MSSMKPPRLSPLAIFCALSVAACASTPMKGGDVDAGDGGGPPICLDPFYSSSLEIENATDVTLALIRRSGDAVTIAPGAVEGVASSGGFTGSPCDRLLAQFADALDDELVLESEDGMYVARLPAAEGWTTVALDHSDCGGSCTWRRTVVQSDLEPQVDPPPAPPAAELVASQDALRDSACACPLDRFSTADACELVFDLARLAGDPECVDAAVAENASVAAWYACEAAAAWTLAACDDDVMSCGPGVDACVDAYLGASCPALDEAGYFALARCEPKDFRDEDAPLMGLKSGLFDVPETYCACYALRGYASASSCGASVRGDWLETSLPCLDALESDAAGAALMLCASDALTAHRACNLEAACDPEAAACPATLVSAVEACESVDEDAAAALAACFGAPLSAKLAASLAAL